MDKEPMRVLLLNPPPVEGVNVVREGRCMQRTSTWSTVWAPVSLATAAAVLRDAGVEVDIIDGIVDGLDHEALARHIAENRPAMVVINTATVSIETDLEVAALVKKVSPGIKIMAMGVHVSALPDSCFEKEEALDMVVRGEPEYTIRATALALKEGSSLKEVKGLSFREGDAVIHNEKRPFIKDLDELPFPAWDLIDMGKYRLPFSNERFLLVASARGCPYPCTFCATRIYYGTRFRKRSPARIVDEMEWAVEQFGIRDFLVWAESFTNDQQYAIDTAEEITRRGLDISWVCNSRVDTVSPRLLGVIREAGCWMIGYGIESGSQEVLDSVRKNTNITQAVQAVRMAREVGLEVTGHCILGFPGETEETMQQTIDFAKSLRLDYAQFYCAVAFPGSVLYEECLENGWLEDAGWKYFEQSHSVISTPQLEAAQVMRARERAYREFYRQPYIIKNTLRKLYASRDISLLTGMVKDFMSRV